MAVGKEVVFVADEKCFVAAAAAAVFTEAAAIAFLRLTTEIQAKT